LLSRVTRCTSRAEAEGRTSAFPRLTGPAGGHVPAGIPRVVDAPERTGPVGITMVGMGATAHAARTDTPTETPAMPLSDDTPGGTAIRLRGHRPEARLAFHRAYGALLKETKGGDGVDAPEAPPDPDPGPETAVDLAPVLQVVSMPEPAVAAVSPNKAVCAAGTRVTAPRKGRRDIPQARDAVARDGCERSITSRPGP